MPIELTKMQILTARGAGHPLFYSHAEDRDHSPALVVERSARGVLVKSFEQLYKVKANPQSKNRVDIYMSIQAAKTLGAALRHAAEGAGREWRVSRADPAAAAGGRMKLPKIVWSRSARFVRAAVRMQSGTLMQQEGGTMYVELERPDQTHIKMKETEIHVGLALSGPEGTHDPAVEEMVEVAEEELQRGTGETNPIGKVKGDFYVVLDPAVAGGLGALLGELEG